MKRLPYSQDSTTRSLSSVTSELLRKIEELEASERRFAEHYEYATADDEREQLLEDIHLQRRRANHQIRSLFRYLLRNVGELRAAGMSEAEKPEALRPMVEAEEKLRSAIFPPAFALTVYLSVTQSALWLLGVAFSLALPGQAASRRREGLQLATRYFRAAGLDETEPELRTIAKQLSDGEDWSTSDLRRLVQRLSSELPLQIEAYVP
jgi:hypothetical protein